MQLSCFVHADDCPCPTHMRRPSATGDFSLTSPLIDSTMSPSLTPALAAQSMSTSARTWTPGPFGTFISVRPAGPLSARSS
eukprot:5444110-Prymnesium_polylepis.2